MKSVEIDRSKRLVDQPVRKRGMKLPLIGAGRAVAGASATAAEDAPIAVSVIC